MYYEEEILWMKGRRRKVVEAKAQKDVSPEWTFFVASGAVKLLKKMARKVPGISVMYHREMIVGATLETAAGHVNISVHKWGDDHVIGVAFGHDYGQGANKKGRTLYIGYDGQLKEVLKQALKDPNRF